MGGRGPAWHKQSTASEGLRQTMRIVSFSSPSADDGCISLSIGGGAKEDMISFDGTLLRQSMLPRREREGDTHFQ